MVKRLYICGRCRKKYDCFRDAQRCENSHSSEMTWQKADNLAEVCKGLSVVCDKLAEDIKYGAKCRKLLKNKRIFNAFSKLFKKISEEKKCLKKK